MRIFQLSFYSVFEVRFCSVFSQLIVLRQYLYILLFLMVSYDVFRWSLSHGHNSVRNKIIATKITDKRITNNLISNANIKLSEKDRWEDAKLISLMLKGK